MTNEIKLKNAISALNELADMNNRSNDFEIYCHCLAQWGMGKDCNADGDFFESDQPIEKPKKEDFGL